MRYPEFLKKGDTIGICAPSCGIVRPDRVERLNYAIVALEEMGYKVIETPSVRTDHRLRSSDAKTRAEEFMSRYENPEVKLIIFATGGEFLCEIYDYLDDSFSNIINANREYELLSVGDYDETTTIIDKAYENYKITGLVENEKQKVISRIFDEWKDTNSISTKAAKLNNKKVVELTGLEGLIKGNSSNDTVSFEYTAQAKLANDETDLVLVNDVEIVGANEEKYSNSYENLIDRAERVVITPPTGENKNNVDTIMITITSLISAIILAGGIKLIKKKVL